MPQDFIAKITATTKMIMIAQLMIVHPTRVFLARFTSLSVVVRSVLLNA